MNFNPTPAISFEGLTKEYDGVAANDDLSFEVKKGEIFGYLGPNGAGKTTTIRQLLGLIKPTSGTAKVLGANIRDRRDLIKIKSEIGYLPDTLGFEERLTGNQILNYFARMRGDERRDELLELFPPPLDKRIETYSSGNLRMLGIIQAFMHNPNLVIMDEPTAGLDPLKQDRLHHFLEGERESGKTIFFSSHILSEVQRICDRVGIIRSGKLVDLDNVEDLLARGGKKVRIYIKRHIDKEEFITKDMIDFKCVDKTIHFTYTGRPDKLLKYLSKFEVEDVEIGDPQLDEIFKHYYGNSS